MESGYYWARQKGTIEWEVVRVSSPGIASHEQEVSVTGDDQFWAIEEYEFAEKLEKRQKITPATPSAIPGTKMY